MNRQKTLEKARTALRGGTLWRAKEILQGNISSPGYDPEIFEFYGQVLLRMGDDIEAGKYLFLSGIRSEEYFEPINKYLNRFRNTGITDFHSNFPRSIRRLQLNKLPPIVIQTLKDKGFTDHQISNALEEKNTRETNWGEKLFWGGCLFLLSAMLIIFGIGLRTLASWFM